METQCLQDRQIGALLGKGQRVAPGTNTLPGPWNVAVLNTTLEYGLEGLAWILLLQRNFGQTLEGSG